MYCIENNTNNQPIISKIHQYIQNFIWVWNQPSREAVKRAESCWNFEEAVESRQLLFELLSCMHPDGNVFATMYWVWNDVPLVQIWWYLDIVWIGFGVGKKRDTGAVTMNIHYQGFCVDASSRVSWFYF